VDDFPQGEPEGKGGAGYDGGGWHDD
jgi:hypothetical protein